MARLTMAEAINQALKQAMAADPRIVVLGEDVAVNGGVFRVTDGLLQQFGENRVMDTPLAESAIIGTAIGMALAGLKPLPEIQFMGFLYSCFDQIASQAARLRLRSGGRWSIPMVIRTPFGGYVRTPELHSDSLESLFVHTPGIKVVVPSGPYDAKGLLLAAIEDPDPVLFMEHMKLYRSFREEVPDEPYTVPLGRAKVMREGSDLTIFAYGAMVQMAVQAADRLLETRGAQVEVVDLRTVAPLDEASIQASVEKTGRALVVHEAVRAGGVAGEIAAVIQERCFYSLAAPVLRVTSPDVPYPPVSIEDQYLPSLERVLHTAEQVLSA